MNEAEKTENTAALSELKADLRSIKRSFEQNQRNCILEKDTLTTTIENNHTRVKAIATELDTIKEDINRTRKAKESASENMSSAPKTKNRFGLSECASVGATLGGIGYAAYNVIVFDWNMYGALLYFIFGIPLCAIMGAIPGALVGVIAGAIISRNNENKKATEKSKEKERLADAEETLTNLQTEENNLITERTGLEKEADSIEIELANINTRLNRLECDIQEVGSLLAMLI